MPPSYRIFVLSVSAIVGPLEFFNIKFFWVCCRGMRHASLGGAGRTSESLMMGGLVGPIPPALFPYKEGGEMQTADVSGYRKPPGRLMRARPAPGRALSHATTLLLLPSRHGREMQTADPFGHRRPPGRLRRASAATCQAASLRDDGFALPPRSAALEAAILFMRRRLCSPLPIRLRWKLPSHLVSTSLPFSLFP